MLSLFKTDIVYPLKDLKDVVTKQIRLIPEMVSPAGEVRGVLRFEFHCESVDGFSWLHNQKAHNKLYWSNRDGTFNVAGIGLADEIVSNDYAHIHDIFATMEDNLSEENPHQRYYGGISFQPNNHGREWLAYHGIYFFIPQFELLNTSEETIFAFNIALKDINHDFIEKTIKDLHGLNFDNFTVYRKVPQKINRTDFPDQKQWKKIFEQLRNDDASLKYEKIVLARKSQFTFDIPIRPEALLKHLADITPNCYHFDFQIDEYRGFIGATPEQLFSLKKTALTTEALAGSIRRGNSDEEDNQLALELMQCPKTKNEHHYVVEAIKNHLIPLCETLNHENTLALAKLRNNQHLITRFKGTVKSEVNAADIIKTLHPTPAVGGVPQKGITDAIRSIEPFDRGWYAAPVGFVGYNHSEFAVAIRSALIENEILNLYAGAGVVEGSTADGEWDEIETKIGNFLKVFSQ